MILYMYIAPGQRQKTPWGQTFDAESTHHFAYLLQVSNKSVLILILYTFLNVFPHIAPGQGQTTLYGQNSDVNRKALSFCPFVASLKKIYL